MDSFGDFKTFLEICMLILTLATQSPWLGVIAAVGFGLLFFLETSDNSEEDEEDNDDVKSKQKNSGL